MPGATAVRLSLNVVKQLAVGDEVRDTELKGFGVRRLETVTSYFLLTRIKGRLRRLTIGKHGSPWTPETARKEAGRLMLLIKQGHDPAAQRDEGRKASEPFETVAERFLESHSTRLKPSSADDYARIVRVQLGRAFNGRPISEIRRADVARAHASWKATPRQANYALAVLSKLLKWAEQHGYRTSGENACAGIDRYKESKRRRFLSKDELHRLGSVLANRQTQGENPFIIGAIRMLILTGARLSEMLTLRWEYVDGERGILNLPDSKTGAKTIVLSPEALQVLHGLPRYESNAWVFPGHVKGNHLVNLQKPWDAIRKEAGIVDVRIHDLRHSYAAVAVGLGGSLPLIGHLLGHTQAQTTARYAHVAASPARELADATGDVLGKALGLTDHAEK